MSKGKGRAPYWGSWQSGLKILTAEAKFKQEYYVAPGLNSVLYGEQIKAKAERAKLLNNSLELLLL